MANSKRRCKQCGEYGEASSGVKVPLGWFCCLPHAVEYAREKSRNMVRRQIAKADRELKAEAKEARKVERQRKMDVKPLSYWMKRAQASVNRYVRARDANLPCISCGRPSTWIGQWHASHYRSVGAASGLRFNLKNIHKACSVCNTHLSGNIMHYRPALIEKIGYDEVERLESENTITRYSVEYLRRIERVFSKKASIIEARSVHYEERDCC